MKNNIATIFYSGLVLTLLLGACSTQRDITLTGWDRDKDNRLNREEFETVFRDRNTYEEWDTNGDNQVDKVEWDRGFNVYNSSYPYDEQEGFDEWDTQRDDYIDENEFFEGIFNFFDSNDNNYIEESEYASYQDQ